MPKEESTTSILRAEAVKVLKSLLPSHWAVREYHPHYGIDIVVDVFDTNEKYSAEVSVPATLGDRFFIQLKYAEGLRSSQVVIQPSYAEGIEGQTSTKLGTTTTETLAVLSHQMECSDLKRVQGMSSAVPVVLVVVDIASSRAFFVCLTDYIDKIVMPTEPECGSHTTKKINIPVTNEITNTYEGLAGLRFYSQRAALIAMCHTASYQHYKLNQLRNVIVKSAAVEFARVLVQYDIWKTCVLWDTLGGYHESLIRLVNEGPASVLTLRSITEQQSESVGAVWEDQYGAVFSTSEMYEINAVRNLWSELSRLGGLYEDICREWYLPSYVGMHSGIEARVSTLASR